jgi:hypothetical protein
LANDFIYKTLNNHLASITSASLSMACGQYRVNVVESFNEERRPH